MAGDNLLGVPETRLPEEPEVLDELESAGGDVGMLKAVAASHPASSLAWAALADAAYDPDRALDSYAFARVGYHRGLDALRKAGWRGQGPIPWGHEPNRGILRCLYALRRAAAAIGETAEVERLSDFLRDADPEAERAIEAERLQSPDVSTDTIVIRSVD